MAFAYVEGGRDPVAVTDELREVAQDCRPVRQIFRQHHADRRERPGVVLRLRQQNAPDRTTLEQIDRVLGLTGRRRWLTTTPAAISVAGCALMTGAWSVRLVNDPAAEAWMRDYFCPARRSSASASNCFAGSATAPAGFTRGRVVCNCFNVSEREVVDFCAAHTPSGGGEQRSAPRSAPVQPALRHQLRVLSAGASGAGRAERNRRLIVADRRDVIGFSHFALPLMGYRLQTCKVDFL